MSSLESSITSKYKYVFKNAHGNIPKKLPKGYLLYEFILTYDSDDQELMYLYINKTITEKEFLDIIFSEIGEDKDNIIKISCCQMYTTKAEDLLPFIFKTNGKYYFKNSRRLHI